MKFRSNIRLYWLDLPYYDTLFLNRVISFYIKVALIPLFLRTFIRHQRRRIFCLQDTALTHHWNILKFILALLSQRQFTILICFPSEIFMLGIHNFILTSKSWILVSHLVNLLQTNMRKFINRLLRRRYSIYNYHRRAGLRVIILWIKSSTSNLLLFRSWCWPVCGFELPRLNWLIYEPY